MVRLGAHLHLPVGSTFRALPASLPPWDHIRTLAVSLRLVAQESELKEDQKILRGSGPESGEQVQRQGPSPRWEQGLTPTSP